VLTEEPAQEMDRLETIYLKRFQRAARREQSGRAAILDKMRSAFQHAGAWDLMRKEVPAADYTHKGDPLKIDCGYQPNGVVKFFHAVSLATSVDTAKVLAFSYPQIREGVARINQAKTELTAVIEPNLPHADEAIAFALDTLVRSSILVATTDELTGLAQLAGRDLHV
jgi:hypothetical protein